ncbi:tail fiber protein [Paludibacterium yongneupense]|uniref:tail fiber protein n=1 Tax=Paludibacterium yongneupense TaxID=400061 RepID=UPI0004242599|nr:tail fiber protein [Paludibacterium yongneupense]
MSQASIVLPQTDIALKKDVDAALAAISTLSAGATDPGAGPGAYAFWADTGNALLKQRSADNTAWVALCPLGQALAVASGNASQQFSVADATENNQAVSLEQLKAAIAAITGAVPVGSIISSACAAAPDGYLLCDGSAVSRTAYATLFAAIGSIYGSGDGSTSFNLPDARGVALRGLDGGRGLDSGRTLGSYQADAIASHTVPVSISDPGHSHGISDPGHSHTESIYNAGGGTNQATPTYNSSSNQYLASTGSSKSGISVNSHTADITASGVYSGAGETRMKNLAINFFIKY